MLIKNNSIKKLSYLKCIYLRFNSKFCKYIEKYNKFDPVLIDGVCSEHWKTTKNILNKDNAFSILLPPPNVTGNLHLGHALSFSLQDTIIRSKKMMGYKAIWIPGFDHAGIATQAQVEKLLQKEYGGLWNSDMIDKGEFVNICNNWSEKRKENISCQIKSLALSPNWDMEYFTLDDRHSQVVKQAFIELYKKQKIYRDNRIINWCCHLRSVISDLEIDTMKINGETKVKVPGYETPVKFGVLYKIAYEFCNDDGELIIATTRPETIPADACVAVHPSDTRYARFIGKFVRNPVTKATMPVIGDEQVDPHFGTGVIKVTPAHSLTDFHIGRKHNLKSLNIIDNDGNMENVDCLNLKGVPRFTAKEIIIKHLIDQNLFRGSDSTHKMTLSICSRSGDIVEYLIRPQWFFDISEACEKAIKKIHENSIKLQPPGYIGEILQFLETKKPWCISRQLKWGHSIPIYSCNFEGNFQYFIGNSKQEVLREFPFLENRILSPDTDVLDTWFSSSLIPLSVADWPNSLNSLFPSSILVTGYDIVPLWVCRMMIMSLELVDQLPFKSVLLHGMICDSRGLKMSKSKGNTIDPMQLIGTHFFDTLSKSELNSSVNLNDLDTNQSKIEVASIGNDAVRFSLLEHRISGHQVKYDLSTATLGRNFMQKMWQTLRFVYHNWDEAEISRKTCSNLEKNWAQFRGKNHMLNSIQTYIFYQLVNLISVAETAQNRYVYHPLCVGVREFWWNSLCSLFLEWSKSEMDHSQREINLELILLAINTCIHLIHPIIPQITEVIWHNIHRDAVVDKSLGNENYPSINWVPDFNSEDYKISSSLILNCLEKMSEIHYWTKMLKLSKTKLKNSDLACLFIVNNEIKEYDEILSRLSGVSLKTCLDNSFLFLDINDSIRFGISKNICDYVFLETCLSARLKQIISRREELNVKFSANPTKQEFVHQLAAIQNSIKHYENKIALFKNYNVKG